MTTTHGETMKTAGSDSGGTQSSLVSILIMSASDCSRPNGPTRLGP